jgi:hypothetical protein
VSDLRDEDEEGDCHEPPRKTSRLAWAVVVLMLVLVLVDVFAIQFLGRHEVRTFSKVGPVTKDTTER